MYGQIVSAILAAILILVFGWFIAFFSLKDTPGVKVLLLIATVGLAYVTFLMWQSNHNSNVVSLVLTLWLAYMTLVNFQITSLNR
jgi:tryptophan-rich sensory protein